MQVDDTTRELIDERVADIRKRRETVPTTSSKGITSSWLARTLNEYGFRVTATTVQNHVTMRCHCGY